MHMKFKEPVSTTASQSLYESQNSLMFDDGDHDLSLQVSILSDSPDPDYELVHDIVDVLRAYGFSESLDCFQAPGSWFAKLKAKFHNQNKDEARRNKAELRKDLRSDHPPHSPAKRKAVGKLKTRLRRLKKKAGTWILMGATMVGQATYDAGKDTVKDWIKQEAPKVEQKVKGEASKAEHKIRGYFVTDIPAGDAKKFHEALDRKIDKSPQKAPIPLPPPPPSK